MQVFKHIGTLFCLLLAGGCSLLSKSDEPLRPAFDYKNGSFQELQTTDYSRVNLGDGESFRVAALLPLTGRVEAAGQSLKNAAMLALGDLNNPNLVLEFYDTKSTPAGARIAVENAINADSRLILGPLLSEETEAVTEQAKSAGVPVISFTTSPAVLQEGIYTLGLLNEEQIERIIRYSVEKGRRKIAIVLPDNQSGINMLKSAIQAAASNGAVIVKAGFYPPETMDFTSLVTAMAGPEKVKASQTKPEPGEEVQPVALDFDALIVPESGNRLKALTSMFSFYDVSAPEVLFLGTSVWANTGLSKETELYGAVYPVMSQSRMNRFIQKYYDMFNERPNSLGILGYDAVALASALARKNSGSLTEEITSPDGYSGMSGSFRIFANGKNEHGLDIVRVTSGDLQLMESAPRKFYGTHPEYASSASYIPTDEAPSGFPKIYGKSASAVKNLLNAVH